MWKVALLFLSACVLINAQTGYPTVPASEFDCNAVADPSLDHFYPSLTTCDEFYRCVPGHAYAYKYVCNDLNEVFDETYQMCVNAWDTYPPCGTKQSTTSGTGTNVPPTVPTADPNAFYCDTIEDGYYPNPLACDSFFICNPDVLPGTSPSAIPCPPGLIYNPDAFYCDWTYNVPPPCGTKVTRVPYDTVTNGPACQPDQRFNCNGATTPVVDSADCSVFYNCDANLQMVCPSKCPDGLLFDLSLGLCNWASAVSC